MYEPMTADELSACTSTTAAKPKMQEAYERSVAANRRFQDALRSIARSIPSEWFKYKRTGKCINATLVESQRQELDALCREWCLISIRASKIGTYLGEVTVVAESVKVKPNKSGTRFDISVPKYYRFRHIEEYQSADFADVKRLMSHNQNPKFHGNSAKQTTHDGIIRIRQLRHKCESDEYGVSSYHSWLYALSVVKWPVKKMEHHFQYCPREPYGKGLARSLKGFRRFLRIEEGKSRLEITKIIRGMSGDQNPASEDEIAEMKRIRKDFQDYEISNYYFWRYAHKILNVSENKIIWNYGKCDPVPSENERIKSHSGLSKYFVLKGLMTEEKFEEIWSRIDLSPSMT